MNSKVIAIDHQEPDRVPLGYGAWREVSEALCEHLGLESDCEYSHFQEYPEALLQYLHVDIRVVRAKYIGPPVQTLPDGSYIDIWGITQSVDNYPIGHPLAHARTVADIESHTWPDPDAFDYKHYGEQCERFEEYAVCGGDWSPFFTYALELMGTDCFLMALLEAPEMAQALLSKITDYYYETSRRMFEQARGKLDIFFMGDDYGMQRGPFISPQMFREFVAPYLKRLYSLAKSYGLKIMHHSCGSVRALIPDLIALGVDILDPVQVGAYGMSIEELKRDFGHQITFHGSINTQATLPFGTTEDVKREVIDRLRRVAPGGGFILSGSQDYIADIPLANIVTIYETAYEYGHYDSLGKRRTFEATP